MNRRTIALTIIGFLIGMLAAASIGVRVIEEVRTDEDATSLPPENVSSTTLPPVEYFVDPNETLIASTALVPTSVRASGTDFAIEYELVSLAPRSGIPPIQYFVRGDLLEFPHEDLHFIYAPTWELTTETQTIEGGPARPDVRVARFDLPEGVTRDAITAVHVIDPLMSFPLDAVFHLSEAEPTVEVIDGVTAELLNVSDQGGSWIVQVEFKADEAYQYMFSATGVGPGWRSAVFEAEGRPRMNFTWIGEERPVSMSFRITGNQWIELEGSYEVAIGRFG
ncbi:MAG: hypothetical protein ABFR95_03800 [Actinomycetota bacterium]